MLLCAWGRQFKRVFGRFSTDSTPKLTDLACIFCWEPSFFLKCWILGQNPCTFETTADMHLTLWAVSPDIHLRTYYMNVNMTKSVAFYVKNRRNFRGKYRINLCCFPWFMFTLCLQQRLLCHKPHKNNKNGLFHGKFMCYLREHIQQI